MSAAAAVPAAEAVPTAVALSTPPPRRIGEVTKEAEVPISDY